MSLINSRGHRGREVTEGACLRWRPGSTSVYLLETRPDKVWVWGCLVYLCLVTRMQNAPSYNPIPVETTSAQNTPSHRHHRQLLHLSTCLPLLPPRPTTTTSFLRTTYVALSELTQLFLLICGSCRPGFRGDIITIVAIFVRLLYKLFVVIFLQVVLLKLIRVSARLRLLLGVNGGSSRFHSCRGVQPDLLHAGDVILHYFPIVALGSVQAWHRGGAGVVRMGENMEDWLVKWNHVNSICDSHVYL